MKLFYQLSLFLLGIAIRIAAISGHSKARLWVEGRKNILAKIREALLKRDSSKKLVWIHCSSLGEFEQGRPLIEWYKTNRKDVEIFLTFYSPSGYEIRKNYSNADYIFYLPEDFKSNVNQFLNVLEPERAFFVKYDFWFNYLSALHQRKIPHYLISAEFRPEQYFFKLFGKWALNHIAQFTTLFVQSEKSQHLLRQFNISNVELTGDTRIDRVIEIKNNAKEIPIVKLFTEKAFTIVCGSTWEPDEEILFSAWSTLIRNNPNLKLIIAPHDISPSHIESIMNLFGDESIPFSRATQANQSHHLGQARVLIIDNIGMLSSLYQYAKIAYIGGGFGTSIHNTLEPASFSLPILFGPAYHKFKEAVDLLQNGGAFTVKNGEELQTIIQQLIKQPEMLQRSSAASGNYIQNNQGATEKIALHLGLKKH